MGKPATGNVTRRDFLLGGLASAASVGVLALAPAAQDTCLEPLAEILGPTNAYAREVLREGEQEFVFDVVGIDEVGIHVVDLTKTDEKGDPVGVPNVFVILTSTDDPSLAQIQERTDEDGKCVLNISSFCKLDEEGKPEGGIYQANVSVTIVSDDDSICEYAIPSMLVIGTTAYRFAVEPYEGKPYLLSASFNKQDIFHSLKTFLRSPYNQDVYEICVRVKGVTETTSVSLTFYRASDTDRATPLIGSPTSKDAELDKTGSYAEAIFAAPYLYAGNPSGLPADDIVIVVEVTGVFSTELLMTVIDAPSDAYAYPGPINTLIPLANKAFDFNIPLGSDKDKFGWFTNMNVSAVTPTLPIHVYITPYYLILGFSLDVKLSKWSLPSNTPAPADPAGKLGAGSHGGRGLGAPSAESGTNQMFPWGYTPESYKDNWVNAVKGDWAKLKNAITNHANPVLNNDNPPNACRCTRFGSINVDILVSALQEYQWDGFKDGTYESKTFSRTASISIGISVAGSYTWQGACGPVPVFITVSLTLSVGVGFNGNSTHETLQLSDGHTAIDTNNAVAIGNNSIAINFGVLFCVSAGAGISGVCSLGLQASIAFNPSLIFYEEGWEDQPHPHTILPLVLRLELVIQVIFFKGSATLLQYKTTSDNWKDTSDFELQGIDAWRGVKPRFALTHPGERKKRHTMTLTRDGRLLADGGDPYANMIPVDHDMMAHSLEAKGTPRTQTKPETYLATAYRDKLPCLTSSPDGKPVVKLVDAPGHHSFGFGKVALDDQADTSGVLTAETLNQKVQEANGADPYLATFCGLGKLVADEYDYDYSAYQKTTRNVCEAADVVGIADSGGIKPSADIPIYEGVYSDARIKVVEIAGSMYQFRISTIEYGQQGSDVCRRGRLTVAKFNEDERIWEDPVVLEYSSGDPDHRRVDLCDYDYDVIARSSGDAWAQGVEACVVVVSGTMGDDFYESAANQMLTVLLIDKDLRVAQRSVRLSSSFFDDHQWHMLTTPRIADGFGLNATSGALGISFVVRSADDKTQLMSTAATVRMVLAQCFVVGNVLSLDFRTTIDSGGSYLTLDPSVTDLVLSASGDDKAGWMRIVAKGGSCYEGWSAVIEDGVAFSDCRIMCNVPSTSDSLPNIQPWTTHGTFLYVRDRSDTSSEGNTNDYYLYAGSFDLDTTQEALSEERVDRGALKGSSFAVSPNGNWLFYFESFQGDPDTAQPPEVVDPDPSLVISGSPDVGSDINRMMACYLVDGKFCEDFVFCNLDHPVDQFAVSGVNFDEASVFTTLEITDADKSTGTVRYLAVPHTAAVEIKAFTPDDEFIIAGQTGHFQLDLFNHGNIIVTGFTATMHDKESGTDLTCVVDTIDPDNIRINATNGKWAEGAKLGQTSWGEDSGLTSSSDAGEDARLGAPSTTGDTTTAGDTLLGLSDEAAEGWLMPSKLMSYIVAFDIPEDWHDERTVTLELSDYHYVDIKQVPEAPNGSLVHPLYLGTTGSVPLSLFDHKANGTSDVYLPATSYDEEQGGTPSGGLGKSDSGSGGKNGTHTGSPSNKNQSLARTGDVTSLANPLALAIGGIGALLAAYSARRTQVERDEHDAHEQDDD